MADKQSEIEHRFVLMQIREIVVQMIVYRTVQSDKLNSIALCIPKSNG